MHLVVQDITEARAELVRRGGEISEIRDFVGGVKGADFSDPDGNNLELQEMLWRRGATYSELADCAQVGCGINVPTVVIALKAAVSKVVGNEVDKVLAAALNVARQEAHAWFE